MARVRIHRSDGSPTAYFYWSTGEGKDPTRHLVYKSGSHGIERVKGVFFNAVTKSMVKS